MIDPRSRLQTFLCILSLLLLGAPTPVQATVTLPVSPNLSEIGWEMLAFDDIPTSEFKGTDDGILEVRADRSSSVLYRAVASDPIKSSKLSWSWQVVDTLPPTDLTQTDGDDRVLAIHVVFAEDSLMARIVGAMSPFSRGRVLTYVWGDSQIHEFPHPHLPEKAWMIVKRPTDTPSGMWIEETADIAADYKRAFGEEAPPVAYIGISGDADDLATTCFGKVRSIALH